MAMQQAFQPKSEPGNVMWGQPEDYQTQVAFDQIIDQIIGKLNRDHYAGVVFIEMSLKADCQTVIENVSAFLMRQGKNVDAYDEQLKELKAKKKVDSIKDIMSKVQKQYAQDAFSLGWHASKAPKLPGTDFLSSGSSSRMRSSKQTGNI